MRCEAVLRSVATRARYRKVAGEEQRQWYERLWPKTVSTSQKSVRSQEAKERSVAKAKAAVQFGLF